MSAQQTDELLKVLLDSGFEFIVVGGVAAIAHGATRSTKDLDVVAPFTASNLQLLIDALRPHAPHHFTRPDLGPLPQTAAELAAHRLLMLTTGLGRLDVLRQLPPIGLHADVETVDMELLPGRSVPVISLDQLIEIKAYLTRPQDAAVEQDLRAIRNLRDAEGSS